MKVFSIIDRYILKELMIPFGISLFFLTFAFLMTRIPEITNMVMNFNADLSVVVLLIIYTLPRFLEFTIPMSVMISVLLTFMRMSGENEIVALKGAGVSLYKLLPPVICFCLIGVILCMWVTVFGVSWGKLSMKKKSVELARSSIESALEERQFNSEIADVMIYVSQFDMKTKHLKDVFIEDRRTKGVVSISTAPEGELIKAGGGQVYTIRLHNGMINQVDTGDNSVNNIRFGAYDINFDLDAMDSGEKISKELDERNLAELLMFIRTSPKDHPDMGAALMELHEKFSIPLACLFLGLLAFPLGVQASSLRKSSGFSMGIFFFLLYYLLLAAGWSGGEAGSYPPAIGMWLPNAVIGTIAVLFLVRNAREKPVPFPPIILKAVSGFKDRLLRIK